MPTTTLRPERIIATLEQLQQRIRERFSNAALVDICEDLLVTAHASEIKTIGQPEP